jgi:hypothetical protein
MTVKTNEFWIDEPFENIAQKIKIDTREVKFGILNSFPKTFERFPRPWIGAIDRQRQSFKLFRVKGSQSTSDLSVIGYYTIRGAKPVVVVKHKLHFTVVFGIVGLLIFVIAVFFLLQKKGIIIPAAIQAAALVIVILFYTYTILKDLRQDEKEIEKILTRALVSADEIDDDDDSNEQ